APALLQHQRDRGPNESECPFQEQVERLVPNLVAGFMQRPSIEEVTRVVHKDVESPKCSDRGLHRFAYIRFIRHASLKRQGMTPLLPNVFDDPRYFLLPPTRDRNLRALP